MISINLVHTDIKRGISLSREKGLNNVARLKVSDVQLTKK